MRPVSQVVRVLVVASIIGCNDAAIEPQPMGKALADVVPVFCLASPGVTQQVADGLIVVTGTSGSDAINCSVANLPVVINAGDGDDWAVGSPFEDIVNGDDGCDRIAGGMSNDHLNGGAGNDAPANFNGCWIEGGRGSGLPAEAGGAIFGGLGNDILTGGPGDDAFNGGEDFDTCEPGPGAYEVNLCEVVILEPVADVTPPTVNYVGNAGTYGLTDRVEITCVATDASGIASSTCANIVGVAYTFGGGLHTFSATATDPAGNVGVGSTSFIVVVTYDGLTALVQQLVSRAGTAQSLAAKLRNAQAAIARGQPETAANILEAFRNEVRAQTGKAIPAANAATLLSFLEFL